MATELMSAPQSIRERQDPTPQEIIASARKAPAPARGALRLSLLTAGLMWASFTPLDFGPLAWICLIPLLVLVRLVRSTRSMYRMIYLGGLAFWVPALQWMRLGDSTMYVAWIALAAYLALYFPLFVGVSRAAVRIGVPLVIAAPVVWSALEFARTFVMTGFGWYGLAHSQYRWIELIQISDIFGTYGVSFVIVAVAAAAAELIPMTQIVKWRLIRPADASTRLESAEMTSRGRIASVAFSLMLVAATLVYGYSRRIDEFPAGPRVALIQGNVPTSVNSENEDWGDVYRRHMALTGQAVRQQPDLIVWPESMFSWPLMEAPLDMTDAEIQAAAPEIPLQRWRDPTVRKALNSLSRQAGAALIIGISTGTVDAEGMKRYNSAVFVEPDRGLTARYDKIHRVPFGEYIPLHDSLPFLQSFTPFRGAFGIQAGTEPRIFEYKGYRYAPIICFEDTVPAVTRRAVAAATGDKEVDVLVNLTNDGWFHGSSELEQHLITAAFRAVETRTPMVRAVNTGISAIIDGDGVIRQRAVDPETGRSKQVEAVLVDYVPLDPRQSLYVAWGDWFGTLCLTLCGAFLVGRGVQQIRRRRAGNAPA